MYIAFQPVFFFLTLIFAEHCRHCNKYFLLSVTLQDKYVTIFTGETEHREVKEFAKISSMGISYLTPGRLSS